LRRGAVGLQGTTGLVGRRRESNALEAPIRQQQVVDTTALAISLPGGSAWVSSVAISELGRLVLLWSRKS